MKEYYNLTLQIKGELYDVPLEAKDYFDALIKGRNMGMQLNVPPRDVVVMGVFDSKGESIM